MDLFKSKLINNPIKIYFWWIVLCVFFCIIGYDPIVSFFETPGSEFGLVFLGDMIIITILGLFLLSVLTSLRHEWFKKYWWLNLIIFISTIVIIILGETNR